MSRSAMLTIVAGLGLVTAACQNDSAGSTAASGESDRLLAAGREPVPAGKLSAPLAINYNIVGNPVVGQSVSIDIEVTSPLRDQPITLHYRMPESGSMTFPASQPESLSLASQQDSDMRNQQLTVTPQREGRLFIVVSAEIDTESGTMMKSMSIPLQVGRSAALPASADVVSEDGQAGISMPAKETP